MKLVRKQVYMPIHDFVQFISELNTIAEEYRQEGYQVERGLAGIVILKLSDGEVHFVPSDKYIKQLVFAN